MLLKKFTDLQKDYNFLKESKESYRPSNATTSIPLPHKSIQKAIKTHATKYLSPQVKTVMHANSVQRLPQASNSTQYSQVKLHHPSEGQLPQNARIMPTANLLYQQTDSSLNGSRRKILSSANSPTQPQTNTRVVRVSHRSNSNTKPPSRSSSHQMGHGSVRMSPKIVIDGRLNRNGTLNSI